MNFSKMNGYKRLKIGIFGDFIVNFKAIIKLILIKAFYFKNKFIFYIFGLVIHQNFRRKFHDLILLPP